jgi:5-carboxymethyl-2-hydroxymuconate isomerase
MMIGYGLVTYQEIKIACVSTPRTYMEISASALTGRELTMTDKMAKQLIAVIAELTQVLREGNKLELTYQLGPAQMGQTGAIPPAPTTDLDPGLSSQ